jgi:putative colanic acid biosynthesis UDP-glucose lipid carrier transferase
LFAKKFKVLPMLTNNRLSHLTQYVVLGFDLIALNLLVLISWHKLESIDKTYSSLYYKFWAGLNGSWIIIGWMSSLYNTKRIASFENFFRCTTHTYFYWMVLIMLYLFFASQYQLSRSYVAIIISGYGVLLFINRLTYFGTRYYLKQSKSITRQVIILGFNDRAKKLAAHLETEAINTRVIGFCEEEENVWELSGYPILSSIDKVIELSKQYDISDIYSTIAPEHNSCIFKIMEQADQCCIHFHLLPDSTLPLKHFMHVNYLGDIAVLTLRKEPLADISNKIKKRILDLIVSVLVTLFILSWLTPLLAMIILIESQGPVFFVQQRTGRNNKSFNCIKFRSMKANEHAHTQQATRDDNRVTKVGRFLRSTSLDEIPQFINVLKGEMSLIGPRPHMLKHTEDYSRLINKYMVRQFVKPGISGWAQVNGYRGEIKTLDQMKGRVECDLWYMENWNFWLDVRILCLTAFNTLKGDSHAF